MDSLGEEGFITAYELYNLLQDSGRSKLILDVRPEDQFEEYCIRTSINISFASPPTTIEDLSTAKCFKYNWNEQECSLKDSVKEYQSRRIPGIFESIILYDDNGQSEAISTLAKLLTTEGKVKNIRILKGGFKEFNAEYPFLISSKKQKKKAQDGLFPTEIFRHFLFLGNNENARNKKQLEALGITHILNMADELENAYANEFTYKHCRVNDTVTGSNLTNYFKGALDFIDEAKKTPNSKVLVHCAMGISRSSTIVIAWVMKHFNWDFETARNIVRNQRKFIKPNEGFVEHLKKFEKEICSTP